MRDRPEVDLHRRVARYSVPSLPGCVTWGETYDDAVEKARECIKGFLEALAKAGDPIPPGEPVEPPLDALIQVPLPTSA